MALMAILAVSALSLWPDEGIRLAAQARQLGNDIRYIQAVSMMRGRRYRIDFAADRYWLGERDGTPLPHPVSNQTVTYLAAGIGLGSSHAYLVFDEDGVPYVDDQLPGTPLAADAVITLSSGGASQELRVSPETGRVFVP